jgi:hypothetical protein
VGSKGTALSPRQWTNSDSVETTFTSSLSTQETTWSLGRYSTKETITMQYPQGSPASETKVMRGSTSSTEQGMAMTLVWGWRTSTSFFSSLFEMFSPSFPMFPPSFLMLTTKMLPYSIIMTRLGYKMLICTTTSADLTLSLTTSLPKWIEFGKESWWMLVIRQVISIINRISLKWKKSSLMRNSWSKMRNRC